jgi:hypothetical protein
MVFAGPSASCTKVLQFTLSYLLFPHDSSDRHCAQNDEVSTVRSQWPAPSSTCTGPSPRGYGLLAMKISLL